MFSIVFDGDCSSIPKQKVSFFRQYETFLPLRLIYTCDKQVLWESAGAFFPLHVLWFCSQLWGPTEATFSSWVLSCEIFQVSLAECLQPPKFQYKDFGFQFLQTMLAVWNCVRQLRMFLFPILSFLFMYFGFVLSFGAQRRPRSRRGSCHVRSFKIDFVD